MLSGGQKSRLNLARAAYRRNQCELIVMDDPLSAVDVNTGRHIMNQLILGLLADKTRILVTHHLDMLEKANKIVVIDDGAIQSVFSSFDELLNSEFAIDMSRTQKNENESLSCSDDLGSLSDDEEPVSESDEEVVGVENNKLIPDDDKSKLQLLFEYVTNYNVCLFVVIIVLELGYKVFMTVSDWYLANWSTSVNNPVSLYIGFGVVSSILKIFSNALGGHYMLQTNKRYHVGLLKSIVCAPVQFYDHTSSGKIISRFSKDMNRLDHLGSDARYLISISCNLIVSLFIIGSIAFGMSHLYGVGLIAAIIPLLYSCFKLYRYFKALNRDLSRLESKAYAPSISHLSETLSGLSVIRAFGVQKDFLEQNSNKLKQAFKLEGCMNFASSWFDLRIECIGVTIASTLLMACMCTLPFITSVDPSSSANIVAFFAVAVLHITDIQSSFYALTELLASVESQVSSVERIEQYSRIKSEKYEPLCSKELPTMLKGPSIDFENICMRYDTEIPKYVLDNVSIHINPGEKVAIVGRTGSGKTSLINALFRLNEIEMGSISIEGIDTRNLHLSELRSSMAIIPQDPILMQGTLRDNLDPLNQYQDTKIWQTLCHVELNKKFNSLSSEIAENGSNLSTGERQLLSLCRALLKGCKTLILDEATANVDYASDALIQSTIRREFSNCSVICIAHRLETIMDYDRVIVMSDGKVVQNGRPRELLLGGGVFWSMVNNKIK
ncbi:hypothetical protein AKO1_014176 [Acrasis kona]|uniref:Uncharacterized protein n=1 Tax=Acrasis kona TaxID=1008807 RepID=A0AAW2Z286_9EUKA